MSKIIDLQPFLDSWPFDPENDARIVRLPDGREVLQVRLSVGLEQYELDGRPDGLKPHGKESWLDYHLDRLAQAKAKGKEAQFELTPAECAELFQEGIIVYYRYLRLFQFKDWPRTVRDTSRNLKVFDLVHRYASQESDQEYLEKWRPYLLRMNAVSRAMIELEQLHHVKAQSILNEAVETIQLLPELQDETFQFEQQRSLAALRDLIQQVEQAKPLSQLEQLEKDLKKAVETQEFERAAKLRDQIRTLRNQDKAGE